MFAKLGNHLQTTECFCNNFIFTTYTMPLHKQTLIAISVNPTKSDDDPKWPAKEHVGVV